ncbi:MAG: hypothetical protein M1118_07505 [Chloroflexi bacterium]|nr:hypothetical protein [Chloroflexota bacterium]
MTATAKVRISTPQKHRLLRIVVLLVGYVAVVALILELLFSGTSKPGNRVMTKVSATTGSGSKTAAIYSATAAPPVLAVEQTVLAAVDVAAQAGSGTLSASRAVAALDRLQPKLLQEQRELRAVKAPGAASGTQKQVLSAVARIVAGLSALHSAIAQNDRTAIAKAAASLTKAASSLVGAYEGPVTK